MHDQRQSVVTATEVYWLRRDQDRQPLTRDDHVAPRNARTSAAARSTVTSPGIRTRRADPTSTISTPVPSCEAIAMEDTG